MTMHLKNALAALLLMAGLALTANAQNTRHKGDDDGIPAAPEPAQLFLLAGGLTLAGCYVAWRRFGAHAKISS